MDYAVQKHKKMNFLIMANALIYSMLIFICFVIMLIGVYLLACFVDSKKAPATFDIKVSSPVSVGGKLHVYVVNINRRKLCPFRRQMSVTDKNNRLLHYEEDVNIPMKLGQDRDLSFDLPLDNDIAPGLAHFVLNVLYVCPNNIIESQWPYISTKQADFTITE